MAEQKTPEQETTEQPTEVKTVTPEDHEKVIEIIRGKCLQVSYTVHRLPKKRKVRGKMAETIAKSANATTKGVRASWTTFSSDHPAVSEFNAGVRALDQLRDRWTIAKSAEVRTGEDDTATISKSGRLIWEQDHEEFHKEFVRLAKILDSAVEKIHKYLDEPMTTIDDKTGKEVVIASIKEMDKKEARDCWEESAYPKDIRLVAGVARERDQDGKPILDENGEPKYIIEFEEYHVSERLSDYLRKRAADRLDKTISETIETSFTHAIRNGLCTELTTFMQELVNRVRIDPVKGHPWKKYCECENAEVIKVVDRQRDPSLPGNHVRVYLAYKTLKDDKQIVVREWMEPITLDEYQHKVRPKKTSERKKIYSGVIENVAEQLEAFREKKARMFGLYGQNAVAAFDDLLKQLNKYKTFYTSSDAAAKKLAVSLKSDEGAREVMAEAIADTIEALENQVVTVTAMSQRRAIKR